MEGGQAGEPFPCGEPLAPFPGDPGFRSLEVPESHTAQGQDHFGPKEPDLLFQPDPGAEGSFFHGGGPVPFGPAFDHVGGVDPVPGDPDGPEGLVQQLAAGADERTAVVILHSARAFAHDHERAFQAAEPAHRGLAVPAEGAGGTVLQLFFQFLKGSGRFHGFECSLLYGCQWSMVNGLLLRQQTPSPSSSPGRTRPKSR
ncbi:unknown [Acidaminococcus sp. CAG:542]|nr:unknown [Acidaminococcus sp. CAG:542]